MNHGRLTSWRSLWRRRSKRGVGEWAVTQVKQRKDWRMSCDVGKATEGLENELWRRWSELCSFSNLSVTSPTSFSNPSVALPTSQLILQFFRCFTCVTAHSPTFLPLLLCHRLFTYVTWWAYYVTIAIEVYSSAVRLKHTHLFYLHISSCYCDNEM